MAEVHQARRSMTTRHDYVNVNVGDRRVVKQITVETLVEQLQILESKIDELGDRLENGLEALHNKIDELPATFNTMISQMKQNPGITIQVPSSPEEFGHEQKESTSGESKFQDPMNMEYLDVGDAGQCRSESVDSQTSTDSGFIHVSIGNDEKTKVKAFCDALPDTARENEGESDRDREYIQKNDRTRRQAFQTAASENERKMVRARDYKPRNSEQENDVNGLDEELGTDKNESKTNKFQRPSQDGRPISSGDKSKAQNSSDDNNAQPAIVSASVNSGRNPLQVSMRDLGTESDNEESMSTDSQSSNNSAKIPLRDDPDKNDKQDKERVKVEPVVDDTDSDDSAVFQQKPRSFLLKNEDIHKGHDGEGMKQDKYETFDSSVGHDSESIEQNKYETSKSSLSHGSEPMEFDEFDTSKDSTLRTRSNTDDELLEQLQQQIHDDGADKLQSEVQTKSTTHEHLSKCPEDPQKDFSFKNRNKMDQQNQQDTNIDKLVNESQQNSDELENTYDNTQQNDETELEVSENNDRKTNSRKRSFAPNFGSCDLTKRRSKSPIPVARNKRITATYSCFKRQKTDTGEDNRQKYLHRMFDFQTECEEAVIKGGVKSESINSQDSLHETRLANGPVCTQNNQQIPVSGLKNEHGVGDNRFVEEAHSDSRLHNQNPCRNISIIQPDWSTTNPADESTNQTAAEGHAHITNLEDLKKDQPQSRKRVSDKELHLLVQKEKQKAIDCTDPKSSHGIDTVICLDLSGSMAGDPLEQAKQFIMGFLEGLDESAADHNLEENVALVTFGSGNIVVQHLTNNYDLIRNTLDSLEANGPSPLWLGIALCLTELSERGGSCTMDSMKVLPRIIIISDFITSVKNRLGGPDAQQVDQKGNTEVSGIVAKNRSSVGSFDFVTVGENVNQLLLDEIGQGRQFTTDDVLYLSQFFRAQDTVNIVLSETEGDNINEDFVKNLMRNRGMTERSERDIMMLIQEKTAPLESIQDGRQIGEPDMLEAQTVIIDDVVEPAFGSRVKANPDWVGYHTRHDLLGTVIAARKQGCLKILWEDGTQERLKYGVNGEYNILVADSEPEIRKDGIAVGTVVERGTDWRWGDQDGGEGNPGAVCSFDEKKKVVSVLWEKGGQGNYRYGYKGCYDVAIRSILQKEREETEKQFYWQMKAEDDNWVFFAPDVNETIESRYSLKDKNTFLVTIEDVSYRISFNSMMARCGLTQINHPIQRLELTKAEWRSIMSNES